MSRNPNARMLTGCDVIPVYASRQRNDSFRTVYDDSARIIRN